MTERTLVVEMDDGSEWAVKLSLIRASYEAHYGKGGTRIPDEDDLLDWAQSDMNWEDVSPFAVMIKPPEPDYGEGWVCGDQRVIDHEWPA